MCPALGCLLHSLCGLGLEMGTAHWQLWHLPTVSPQERPVTVWATCVRAEGLCVSPATEGGGAVALVSLKQSPLMKPSLTTQARDPQCFLASDPFPQHQFTTA